MNYCHICGTKLYESAIFCHECGNKLPTLNEKQVEYKAMFRNDISLDRRCVSELYTIDVI